MSNTDTMGVRLVPAEGRPNPAPPLPTRWIAIAALVFFAVAAIIGAVSVDVMTKLGPELVFVGYGVFALAVGINLIPLVGMFKRSGESRRFWAEDAPVPSREKAAASRNLGIASIGISIIVTLLLVTVIFVYINDAAVQKTFFDPEIIALSFVQVTKAFGVNILIAVCAMALSIVFGLALAILRLLPGRGMKALRWIAIAIIDAFRSLPAVVVIYLVCFGLPLTKIPVISEQDPILYAIIALTLVYSAYLAELFRSGIEAIHGSQYSAALSLGLSVPQVYRMVVVPQMARNIAPPLLGYFVGLQKDTALVNVVGIIDAFTQSKIYSSNYFNLSAVTVVCILFIVITIPQTRFVDYLLARSDSKKSR